MRWLIVHLSLLTAMVSACDSGPIRPQSVAASASVSAPDRLPLPSGFPLPPGASPAAMPNGDPGLVGLWTTKADGSTVYDFYLRALPAVGYQITGAYAGDTVAQFLFITPGGVTSQIDLYTNPDMTTRIEVRLPRP